MSSGRGLCRMQHPLWPGQELGIRLGHPRSVCGLPWGNWPQGTARPCISNLEVPLAGRPQSLRSEVRPGAASGVRDLASSTSACLAPKNASSLPQTVAGIC